MLDPRDIRRMYRGSSMVLEITALVGIAAFAGAWVDRHLGTSPLLLMLLSFGALAGGMFRLIRALDSGPQDRGPPNQPAPPGSPDDGHHPQ